MRYIVMGARIIEGLIFVIFGLNALLHFYNPPPPSGDALTLMSIMAQYHWINFVAVVELVGGLLLLVNRFVPLALTILAPVIVNILLFHALLWPHGFGAAVVVLAMELFLLSVYWRSFVPLLHPNPELKTPKI